MSEYEKEVGIHKPGSIQRVKLSNFLTYSNVEFSPGPRLNMVVGPNGTGKSTILCAICLGLGGEPKLLGRADDARLFIMHDREVAMIEIELTPFEGGELHIFKRKIDRTKGGHNGKGASTFYVNDSKVTAKHIRELVTQTYHISVDNLCTFLPQDRVGNFSGFGPQELLIETEKSMSASGHLHDTHMALIEMEAELKQGGTEVESIEDKLKRLEADNERLEREKERMEEREEAERQYELLNKKFLWLKFDECRDAVQSLKAEKDAARAKLKESQKALQPLEEAHAAICTKKERYDARYKTLDANMKKSKKEMDKQHVKQEKHAEDLEETLTLLNSLDAEQRQAEKKIEKARERLEQIEQEVADLPSKEQVDEAQAEAAAAYRKIRPDFEKVRKELSHAHEAVRDLQDSKGQALSKLAKMTDEKEQRRNHVFRSLPDLAKICQWLDLNKTRFRRPVWGPVACEVTTKSHNAASFLEQHVPNSTLKSFVVECKDDYDTLYREIRGNMKVPINILIVANGKLLPVERMYSNDNMRVFKEQHGVSGYLDEAFTAPDAILQALRSSAQVHKVLVGGSKTQASIDDHGFLNVLSQPEAGQQGIRGYNIFANRGEKSFQYKANVSRYSRKLAISADDVRPPRLLKPGVNPALKAKLEEEIETMNTELRICEKRQQDLLSRRDEFERQAQEAQARLKHAKDAQSSVSKAHTKLNNARRKLRELEEEAVSDNAGEKEKLLRKLQARMASCVTALEAHADQQAQLMQSTFASAGVRINQDVMTAAERQSKETLVDAQKELVQLERETRRLLEEFSRQRDGMRQLKSNAERDAPIVDDEGNALPLKAELESLPVTSVAETEAAMEEAKAKVNGIEANPEVIRQYQERKKEIELIRAQLSELTQSKYCRISDLEKKRLPWEQALENAVAKVNALFETYMAELGCAGDVQLAKGGDDSTPGNFKEWGIQIRVKFREKSKLEALSARRQSGGERSVSTIMYLMALQELMVSPFRCVDEINQGLDERNERLVFKRIVENASRPPRIASDLTSHSGQYFLITPKLLPNLYDMEVEAMTVLCIFNGPHNFESPLDWNKDRFIEAAARLCSPEDDDVVDENRPSPINSNPGRSSPGKRRRMS